MSPKHGFIAADLHMHSIFSDGYARPEEMYQQAARKKLSVISLTDHNTVSGYLHLIRQKEVPVKTDPEDKRHLPLLIPGFELSLRYGHFLILGIDAEKIQRQLKRWKIPEGSIAYPATQAQEDEYLTWAVKHGGFVVAAHPCIPSGILSVSASRMVQHFKAGRIHAAEVHNFDFERKIFFLSMLWSWRVRLVLEANKIPAMGHSDAHRLKDVGVWHDLFPKKLWQECAGDLRRVVQSVRVERTW